MKSTTGEVVPLRYSFLVDPLTRWQTLVLNVADRLTGGAVTVLTDAATDGLTSTWALADAQDRAARWAAELADASRLLNTYERDVVVDPSEPLAWRIRRVVARASLSLDEEWADLDAEL